jgi:hypothetical protein
LGDVGRLAAWPQQECHGDDERDRANLTNDEKRAHLIDLKREHLIDTWRRFLTSAGFVALTHYYRPAGLPRERQPWLATIWRR